MSGKGVVRKSYVTELLTSALTSEGYQVGVLDADINGPDIPMLFGLHGPVMAGIEGHEHCTELAVKNDNVSRK